jgi:hypothetical protein
LWRQRPDKRRFGDHPVFETSLPETTERKDDLVDVIHGGTGGSSRPADDDEAQCQGTIRSMTVVLEVVLLNGERRGRSSQTPGGADP